MYTYKVILSYKGTKYSGWQNQTGNPMTIQNQVETVISHIVNHQEFKVIGASRTDTGVHARGQVLKIVLPKKITPEKLQLGLNSKLPIDIRVMEVHEVQSHFNVNRDTKSKEYHYYFSFKQPNALYADFVYYIPQKLDLQKMKKACSLIRGEHNFLGLSTQGSRTPNPMRKVSVCSIHKANLDSFGEDVYFLKIKGNGFLKYMVRFIMGALMSVAKQELSFKDLERSLSTGADFMGKKKAPALGLHLIEIEY
jgi:tRNA pseudouridine38-40 synthase